MRRENLFVPSEAFEGSYEGEYLRSSIPLIDDFYHQNFADFLRMINHPFIVHRKAWEFAFIYEKLRSSGVLKPGNRGLCFGAGKEPLPSLFASLGCEILATDAPPGTTHGDWKVANEYSQEKKDLFFPDIVSKDVFEKAVGFSYCDMNHIERGLKDFDFCWSACCLEHLGSLQHGIDFIISSVEKSLTVGGYACHTTEMNLSSNTDTVETPNLSLYRRKDLLGLIEALTQRGHEVEPLKISMGASPIDYYVDLPPYSGLPHVKLKVDRFVSTSVGLLIRRGR